MSKSRIMGAASSGSNYGVNKNSPGNGNGKWQGLWPSVGHARNIRYINTRAGGDNRNVVFCMNQLGGVGRISNMFATTADGVQDCKNGCVLPSNIKNALQQLTNYAGKRGLLLGLAGVKETPTSDLPNTSGLTPFDKNFSPEMQQYVDLINGLGLEFAVTGPKDIQRHEVVMLSEPDAKLLKGGGFGFPVSSLCDNILAYGFDCKSINAKATLGKDLSLTLTFSYSKAAFQRVSATIYEDCPCPSTSPIPDASPKIIVTGLDSSAFEQAVGAKIDHLFDFDKGDITVQYSPKLDGTTQDYGLSNTNANIVSPSTNLPPTGKGNEFQVWASLVDIPGLSEGEQSGGNFGGFRPTLDVKIVVPSSVMSEEFKEAVGITSKSKQKGPCLLSVTDSVTVKVQFPSTEGSFEDPTKNVECAFDVSCE